MTIQIKNNTAKLTQVESIQAPAVLPPSQELTRKEQGKEMERLEQTHGKILTQVDALKEVVDRLGYTKALIHKDLLCDDTHARSIFQSIEALVEEKIEVLKITVRSLEEPLAWIQDEKEKFKMSKKKKVDEAQPPRRKRSVLESIVSFLCWGVVGSIALFVLYAIYLAETVPK